MNKQRKQKIYVIINELNNLKEKIELICQDEQNYFDNMPENFQGSMRGSESEESIDILEESIELLEEVINKIEEI